MKNVKKLLVNTLLLTGVSFLMQTVNVSYNVWLTNRIGSAGIGLFQLIMTVYSLAVTLGCGGIRLAATRLTAEEQAHGKPPGKILKRCIEYSFVTGCVACLLVLCGADLIAKMWLADARSASPIRILALALPFVAMSSAMNGYFTALRKVAKYSVVRVLEQAVRIAIVASLLGKLLPLGIDYSCIAIVAGIFLSEVFSFICLFILYNTENGNFKLKAEKQGTLKKISHIAVPDVAGTGARSILLTIEHLLIPSGFRKSGSSAEEALSVYGNIHGMVFPLLLYPSAILSSLSGLLVPEIAECRTRGFENQINYIIKRVLKITLIFSIGTCFVMYIFAQGLSETIYKSSEAVFFIKLLSPLVPIMYCDMMVDGILKGLDQQLYSMKYNIIDSALCVVLVYFLLPRYSVKGYVIVLFASEIINFFLSIRRLTVVSTVTVNLMTDVLMPCACAFCSATGAKIAADIIGFSASFSPLSLAVFICTAVAAYFLMMYMSGCITKEDTAWFKSLLGFTGRQKAVSRNTFSQSLQALRLK